MAGSGQTPHQDSHLSSAQRGRAVLLVSACVYAATFLVGFALPTYAKGFSAVWPAGGIALAVLLLSPTHRWPAQVLAFFVAGNVANLLAGKPLGASLGFMVANMVETAGSAWLLRRTCGEWISFARVRDVVALLACAFGVNAVSGVIGAGTGVLASGAPFGPFWHSWVVADGLGLLLITPVIVTCMPARVAAAECRRLRSAESLAFACVWVVACHQNFAPDSLLGPHPYTLIALLCWPALRLGPRAVSGALLVMAAMVITSPAVMTGPLLWGGTDLVSRLAEAQLFIAFAAATGLLLAASQAERRAAERESARSEERYRTVVEHTGDLITRVDTTGQIDYVNASALEFWGLPASACVGRSALGFVHPDDQAATGAAFAQWLQKDDGGLTFENRTGTPEHGWRDVLWTITPMRDQSGAVTHLNSIARDITERKAAEAHTLHQARLESVGRLAGGVAHGYNNALQAILGHIDLALESAPVDDPIRSDLESIRALATRSAALTGQLLAFSAQQPSAPRDTDLNALLAGFEPDMRQLLGNKAALTWTPGNNVPAVSVDPLQVEQMLTALIVNSRDAVRAGGSVAVTTTAERHGSPAVEYAAIRVTDNGNGIAPEALTHLFEPFYTTKPVGQGTGISLAAVHGMVRRLGGTVEVDSEVGRGTTVTILLPACQTHSPARPAKSNSRAEHPGATILFVDDDDAVRRVTRRALERRGYRIIEASSAEEALEFVERTNPAIDLVLTDIVMPGRGGHYLRERMAELRPDTKCLLISGFTQDAAPEGAPFLAKPFSADALVRRVEHLLAG